MGIEGTAKGSPPPWLIHFCDWFWRQHSLVWGTILFSIASGTFTGWLFADPTSLSKVPFNGLYQNRVAIAVALIILGMLFLLSYVVRLVPASKSEHVLKHMYLKKHSHYRIK